MSKIVRPIHCRVGEIVEIIWSNEAGEKLRERHMAPPPEVWKARLEHQTAMRQLEETE